MNGPFTSAKEIAEHWIQRAEAAEAENARLREALRSHHEWHQNLGEIGLYKDDNGEWVAIDMSLEYTDSALCRETFQALSSTDQSTAALKEAVVKAAMRFHKEGDGVNTGTLFDLFLQACDNLASAEREGVMTEHFNKLTPAEAERLAYLAEELAEAIQAIGKIQRHGYQSYNPCAPEKGNNREQLTLELSNVQSAIDRLTDAGDLNREDLVTSVPFARSRADKWMHHQ